LTISLKGEVGSKSREIKKSNGVGRARQTGDANWADGGDVPKKTAAGGGKEHGDYWG